MRNKGTVALTSSIARGFTLVDLMIAISLLLLIMTIGVPSFTHLLNANRQRSSTYTLIRTLNYARQVAIDRSQSIIVCPTINHISCVTDWAQELMVFVDQDNNKKHDGNEELLRLTKIIGDNQRLNWKSLRKNFIEYTATGGTNSQNGRFYFCNKTQQDKYRSQLIVYKTGRIRIVPEELHNAGC